MYGYGNCGFGGGGIALIVVIFLVLCLFGCGGWNQGGYGGFGNRCCC